MAMGIVDLFQAIQIEKEQQAGESVAPLVTQLQSSHSIQKNLSNTLPQ